ncbi:BREX-1 system adenine-specific DNA-methyltransferase PglX [Bacillus sp. ISL-40]|uniref:BREX-1 system adenine-specific DNA-methyltransferase PglX n=1 Tax=Bacillus sp. ISL-40 TaxID=2819126 RepID=UPI001BEA9B97|nr:BREX-1 system adenine-specific DNA-methyltransferase PglX [Bacillus sp. ISL-40]MBT2696528.1 BREX-1 system adenine-specific DNA-methyltransferase PglX [Bacillus sp. ISL-40]
MKPEQKKAINRTILKCRTILEEDIENRLVTYGILMDDSWIEKDKLSLSDEQEQVYKDLRDAIAKEMKGGLSETEALVSYIREVTYTYLNRIAALRVMEVRGLMEEVLVQREEYSNRSYGHRNFFEIAREFCKAQSDEGLSYYISLIFNEISSDIGLLFNTDDEYSIIGPSNQALVEIIRLLTTDIDEDSWHQDEIIGWIYQYFNEEEKDDVFDRLYNKKEKIKSIDIPAATQLFTPDWIVNWIVNNSLGKLRKEIINEGRDYKKLEEIKLLDPACGSGHFLVKAYDLFYQYYVEDGYPKEEIPFLILGHNLYGIDIDARAIQLTALILYIKVRVSLKNAGVQELTDRITVNLVCADAVLLNGDRLTTMKKQFENNPTILQMIEIIYEEFTDTRLKGSLIQPEKRLIPLIEEYKQKKQKDLKKGKKNENLGLFEGFEDFEKKQEESVLTKSEKELFQYLEQIYNQATRANDINNLLFANEAKKSLSLINIFMNRYDIVVTNPPYMGKKNMNNELIQFFNNNYKGYDEDLYSVFIKRCIDFLIEDGFLFMITQHTFMYIKSFVKLREYILDNHHIEKIVSLGTRVFDDISGEKVNSVILGLRNKKSDIESAFIRLVDIKDAEGKMKKLNEITQDPSKFIDKYYYKKNQKAFYNIEGYPFIYQVNNKIINLFKNQDNLGKLGLSKIGLQTGDDKKYLFRFWEVDLKKGEWAWYTKSETFDNFENKFYNFTTLVINWDKDTQDELSKSKKARTNYLSSYFTSNDKKYIFKDALTFTLWGAKDFEARVLPSKSIFDVAGSCIFLSDEYFHYILGFLNSSIGNFLMNTLNPTFNYQKWDLDRLPIVLSDRTDIIKIKDLVIESVDIRKRIIENIELNPDYKGPLLQLFKKDNLKTSYINAFKENGFSLIRLNNIREQIDEIFLKIYDLNKEDIILNYDEAFWKEIDAISNLDEDPDEKLCYVFENGIDLISSNGRRKKKFYPLETLSVLFNTDLKSVIDVISQNEVVQQKDFYQEVFNLISFYVACVFDRWNFFGTRHEENSGIIQIDEDFINDGLYNFLEEIFGESNSDFIIDEEMPSILKDNIKNWFTKNFFDEHLRMYQKRPIYWHICSPNKTFNALLYYHALTPDTLYKLKSSHLKPLLDNSREDLNFYREKMSSADDKKLAKQFEKRVTELEKKVNDLEAFDKQIDDIIASGYKPDIDQGILYNIKPLNPILAKKIEK